MSGQRVKGRSSTPSKGERENDRTRTEEESGTSTANNKRRSKAKTPAKGGRRTPSNSRTREEGSARRKQILSSRKVRRPTMDDTVDKPHKVPASKRKYREDDEIMELSDKDDRNRGTKDNSKDLSDAKDMTPQVVLSVCKGGLKTVIKDFKQIKNMEPSESECTVFAEFESKNRYADVHCLDATRVVLKQRKKEEDYIHANYITLPNHKEPRYICAQGPTDDTAGDFWHMTVTEKVTVVVMLCQFMEDESEKCFEYYPTGVGQEKRMGDYTVRCEDVQTVQHNIRHSTFSVLDKSLAVQCRVNHVYWADWPDHMSPCEAEPVMYLHKLVKDLAKDQLICVHCSAGVGRTGCFVACDFITEQLRKSHKKVNIVDICKSLRKQRAYAIQSIVQFMFVYFYIVRQAATDDASLANNANVKAFCDSYQKYMRRLKEKVTANRKKRNDAKKNTDRKDKESKHGKKDGKNDDKDKNRDNPMSMGPTAPVSMYIQPQ